MGETTQLKIRTMEVNEVFPERVLNQAIDQIDGVLNGANAIALADANTTLTDAQVKHYAMLKFTGTLTAIRDITIPAGQHFWWIQNATTHRLNFLYSGGASLQIGRYEGGYYGVWADGTDLHLVQNPRSPINEFNLTGTSLDMRTHEYETDHTTNTTLTPVNWRLGCRVHIDVNNTGNITIGTVGSGSTTVIHGAQPATNGQQIIVICVNADETNPDFLVKVF